MTQMGVKSEIHASPAAHLVPRGLRAHHVVPEAARLGLDTGERIRRLVVRTRMRRLRGGGLGDLCRALSVLRREPRLRDFGGGRRRVQGSVLLSERPGEPPAGRTGSPQDQDQHHAEEGLHASTPFAWVSLA